VRYVCHPMKEEMNVSPADLCIGIVARKNTCEVATLDASGTPEHVGFPVSQSL